jgi:mannose/fructose/N-acetylgalactosamine-specific phosphotransferase system component IIB
MPPQANTDKDGKAASAQTALQVAQIKTGADAQKHEKELAFKGQQAEADRALEQQRIQLEIRKLDAQARSEGVQLQIKQAELEIKRLEVQIKQQSAQNDVLDRQQDRELAANDQAHQHEMDRTSVAQTDEQNAENSRQFDASQAAAATNQQESSPGG